MVALHVAHYWPGGLVRWVTDFMAGDSEESYVLDWEGTSDVYGIKYILRDKHGAVRETFSHSQADQKCGCGISRTLCLDKELDL